MPKSEKTVRSIAESARLRATRAAERDRWRHRLLLGLVVALGLIFAAACLAGCSTTISAPAADGIETLAANAKALNVTLRASLGGATITPEQAKHDTALSLETDQLADEAARWSRNHREGATPKPATSSAATARCPDEQCLPGICWCGCPGHCGKTCECGPGDRGPGDPPMPRAPGHPRSPPRYLFNDDGSLREER